MSGAAERFIVWGAVGVAALWVVTTPIMIVGWSRGVDPQWIKWAGFTILAALGTATPLVRPRA